jgi:small-conductance mechanosensitive channel
MFFMQIIFTALTVVLGLAISSAGARSMEALSAKRDVNDSSLRTMEKTFNISATAVVILLLVFIWGVKITSLWVLGTSLIGFLGVALFASWSFLSNITAGIIIFLTSPFGIGDTVSFNDGGSEVKGTIDDISLFFMYLTDGKGIRVSVPNNLVLQKTVRLVRQKAEQ